MGNTVGDEKVAFCVTDQTPAVRFLASLSDGRTVIEDDRPNDRHAWIRLQEFVNRNPSLNITALRLQCPDGREFTMPSGQQGYLYGKKQRKIFPGGKADYVGIGYYDGYLCSIHWYRVPDLKHGYVETRDKRKAGFFLIENKLHDQRESA